MGLFSLLVSSGDPPNSISCFWAQILGTISAVLPNYCVVGLRPGFVGKALIWAHFATEWTLNNALKQNAKEFSVFCATSIWKMDIIEISKDSASQISANGSFTRGVFQPFYFSALRENFRVSQTCLGAKCILPWSQAPSDTNLLRNKFREKYFS